MSPVEGRLGTGGIWVKPLADGEPRLVRYEETEYRARPAWTPDGYAILYSSDEPGSNDIAIVPAAGGNPGLRDRRRDERIRADRIARRHALRVRLESHRPDDAVYGADRRRARVLVDRAVDAHAQSRGRPPDAFAAALLGPDGNPTPARIYPMAADKRAYAPDGGFHRVIAATETHYFHTTGQFELEVPAGPLALEAMKGFEYRPAAATVQVPCRRNG